MRKLPRETLFLLWQREGDQPAAPECGGIRQR
jgi:hypothetical protein